MKKTKEYYLSLPYTMKITKDENLYVANYKEYPNIIGCGETKAEAMQDLDNAFDSLISALLENNKPIIEPQIKEKKTRVNVLIKDNLLKSVEKITKNRSAFFNGAIDYIIKNKIVLNA